MIPVTLPPAGTAEGAEPAAGGGVPGGGGGTLYPAECPDVAGELWL